VLQRRVARQPHQPGVGVEAADQRGHPAQLGARGARALPVGLAAQHPDHAAHRGHRVPARRLDRGQRAVDVVGGGAGDHRRRLRGHDDAGDVVGHHVVQLPRELHPLGRAHLVERGAAAGVGVAQQQPDRHGAAPAQRRQGRVGQPELADAAQGG
jgi:hypothetical protein